MKRISSTTQQKYKNRHRKPSWKFYVWPVTLIVLVTLFTTSGFWQSATVQKATAPAPESSTVASSKRGQRHKPLKRAFVARLTENIPDKRLKVKEGEVDTQLNVQVHVPLDAVEDGLLPPRTHIEWALKAVRFAGKNCWLFRRPDALLFCDEAAVCSPELLIPRFVRKGDIVTAPVFIRWKFDGQNIPNDPAIIYLRFQRLRQNGEVTWRLLPDIWWKIDSPEALLLTLVQLVSDRKWRENTAREVSVSSKEEAQLIRTQDFYFYREYAGRISAPPIQPILRKNRRYLVPDIVRYLCAKVASDRYHSFSHRSHKDTPSVTMTERIQESLTTLEAANEAARCLHSPSLLARCTYESVLLHLTRLDNNSKAAAKAQAFLNQSRARNNRTEQAYALLALASVRGSQYRHADAHRLALRSLHRQQATKDFYLPNFRPN